MLDERQNHAAQGGIDVQVILRDRQIVQNLLDAHQIIDGPFHGRADVGEDDRRHVAVDADRFAQVFQIDAAVRVALDHDVPHVQTAEDFIDRVVRVFGVIDDPLGMQLPAQEDAVHIPFGAAAGDVSPTRIVGGAGQAGEDLDHLALEIVRVELVIARHVGIAHVVERVPQKAKQRRIIEDPAARVADERALQVRQAGVQVVEPPAIDGRKFSQFRHRMLSRMA